MHTFDSTYRYDTSNKRNHWINWLLSIYFLQKCRISVSFTSVCTCLCGEVALLVECFTTILTFKVSFTSVSISVVIEASSCSEFFSTFQTLKPLLSFVAGGASNWLLLLVTADPPLTCSSLQLLVLATHAYAQPYSLLPAHLLQGVTQPLTWLCPALQPLASTEQRNTPATWSH